MLDVNSLTYFSPSYPHFGVSLNSMAEKSSSFAFSEYVITVMQHMVAGMTTPMHYLV